MVECSSCVIGFGKSIADPKTSGASTKLKKYSLYLVKGSNLYEVKGCSFYQVKAGNLYEVKGSGLYEVKDDSLYEVKDFFAENLHHI